ncbi:hypothetical protein TURU_004975 [Turdus rufiventris]|nr:hypothetical protein TURU_004975 [Turdus rufiventris]
MDSRIKGTLSKFVDDTELCSAVNTLEGRDAIQRDLERHKRWAYGNLTKVNLAKCKVLHLSWGNPKHKYRLGREWVKSSPGEKDLEVLVDKKLNISWEHQNQTILEEYCQGGYKVSWEKAQIMKQQVTYQGFEIIPGQWKLGTDKKEAICQFVPIISCPITTVPDEESLSGLPVGPLQEYAVGDSVKSLAEVQIDNIHNSSCIHQVGHVVIKGDQVWELMGTGVHLDGTEARNLGPLTQDSGVDQVKEQQVPIATWTVHNRQYWTNRDALIPINKMIPELETQGVVRKSHSAFNSPIWPVHKSDGEWRFTLDYHTLNEVTPPLSAAMLDMLELQYELESKVAQW